MKNKLSLFCLIVAFLILYSNIQVTRIEHITYYPTVITMIAPAFTPYPTYTNLSCPTQEAFAIKTSEEGLHFIAYFEGLRNAAYLDALGHCTVGIGHKIRDGACKAGDWPLYVTDEQAWVLLRDDVSKVDFQIYINGWKLTQWEWDSISSIIFNMGWPNFKKTRIYKAIEDGNYKEVPDIIKNTTCCVDSLITRRKAEAELFGHGVYVSLPKNA